MLLADRQVARYTTRVMDQMNQRRRDSDQHTTRTPGYDCQRPTLQNARATVLYKAD
jgi:hypothetical protein